MAVFTECPTIGLILIILHQLYLMPATAYKRVTLLGTMGRMQCTLSSVHHHQISVSLHHHFITHITTVTLTPSTRSITIIRKLPLHLPIRMPHLIMQRNWNLTATQKHIMKEHSLQKTKRIRTKDTDI